ncbi:MAG: ABC transporter ATP-binding protein [Nocardioidaceae bacterium]
MAEPLLSVRDLSVSFRTDSGVVRAVDRVSYDVHEGETLGVVGESGSGKSVTVMSLLRLVAETKQMTRSGEAIFQGRDLLGLSQRELRAIRGNDIALVPQDPMTCLDPVFKVGEQVGEAIQAHHPAMRGATLRKKAIELLELVGIPQPDRRYMQYPHEYSGGMRQRAMIAMAIANEPKLLIADEPTTALDVTIQAQILEVLKTAQEETHASVILITHDLGLIAEMAHRVVVMYAGHVVETGDVQAIFERPRHPYTLGLMNSLPQAEANEKWLKPIPGSPPNMAKVPPGCPFHPRCSLSRDREVCRSSLPDLEPVDSSGHASACHFKDELSTDAARLLASAEQIT